MATTRTAPKSGDVVVLCMLTIVVPDVDLERLRGFRRILVIACIVFPLDYGAIHYGEMFEVGHRGCVYRKINVNGRLKDRKATI